MKKGAVSMRTQKNAAVGDRPTNEELVQRLQEGDTSAAEELLRQNSGYLTVLQSSMTGRCEVPPWKRT